MANKQKSLVSALSVKLGQNEEVLDFTRQRENDVWSSAIFAYITVNMHGVNFAASMLIVF